MTRQTDAARQNDRESRERRRRVDLAGQRRIAHKCKLKMRFGHRLFDEIEKTNEKLTILLELANERRKTK